MPGGEVDPDPGLSAHVRAHAGACGVAVYDPDVARASAGLDQAIRDVAGIRNPDEPAESIVSFIYPVVPMDDGSVACWFDAGDAESFGLEDQIVTTLVRALERAGVSGRLVGVDAALVIRAAETDPDRWTGKAVPPWLPLPDSAVVQQANFWQGEGFVEYWTRGPSRRALDEIAVLFASREFAAGSIERVEVPDEREIWVFTTTGHGRTFRAVSGATLRSNLRTDEVEVNVRANRAPTQSVAK
ncbi:MAG: hypothetical protein QOK28_1921 [Actinomycetota bacterium]|jgi:hypothetical protein